MNPLPSREQTQAGEIDGVLPAPASSSPLHSPSDGGEEILAALLDTWISLSGPREQRRFLQAQPELLDLRTETILHERLAQEAPDQKKVFQLRDALNLLHDARERGGTVEAIREAYINAYGGLSLDIPEWLEEVERQVVKLRGSGRIRQTATERAGLLQNTLTQAQGSADAAPELIATLQRELAAAFSEYPGIDRSQALEAAIPVCELALLVYTSGRYPRQYAHLQCTLGSIYQDRMKGERWENLEQALACHSKALQTCPLEDFPSEYAQTQYRLGIAYFYRFAGERRENLERALAYFHQALRVRTLEALPYEYARTQTELGTVYGHRIAGERR